MVDRLLSVVAVVGLAIALASCAYKPGYDHPAARKFVWYSYLNGDDLRADCRAGAPARYRMVYNGDYEEQVRGYDLTVAADGSGRLDVHVFGRANLREVQLDWERPDPFAPWKGRTEQVDLRREDVVRLDRALAADGALAAAPAGLELPSDGFYWIVAACRGGRMHFNAFLAPSDRFVGLSFDDLLFGWDPTGIKVAEPGPKPMYRQLGEGDTLGDRSRNWFQIRVGENGLWGLPPRF